MRSFKGAVSGRARLDPGVSRLWQHRYYEHVIRDQVDFERMAAYIVANPSM